ncbi:MAG: hypothetical protein R5N77_09490, partial [Cutibacterium granulosum]|nr:hypothetical protein [Cutibacterium granulosum]
EREVPFGGTCRAIGDGSVFYTVPELKRCLTGASVPADSWRVATPQQSGTSSPWSDASTPNSHATTSPGLRGGTAGSNALGSRGVESSVVSGGAAGSADAGRPGLPATGS